MAGGVGRRRGEERGVEREREALRKGAAEMELKMGMQARFSRRRRKREDATG